MTVWLVNGKPGEPPPTQTAPAKTGEGKIGKDVFHFAGHPLAVIC